MKDTKVYLIYPPISKQERYSSELGHAGGEQIPLGIYYLSSYLKQFSYKVQVSDGEALKLEREDIIKEIALFKPDFIGISSSTVAFHRAAELARHIKSRFAEIPLIIGGPHITAAPEDAMSLGVFDYGVIGEGEITLKELLEAHINQSSLENIDGICYFSPNKELVINPRRAYISDLDSLPFPAYELIPDIELYTPPPSNYISTPVVNIITSRGCPSRCTFCDKNIFGNLYRKRSPEDILKEIKYLKVTYDFREIAFVDDTFLIDKKRVYALFDLLDKENIHFHWTCMSRINDLDLEYLKFIKSKGCWHISLGIESGNKDILKIIKKNISLEKVEQLIKWCHNLGIKTKGFFIVGHPLETIETLDETIALACHLKLDDIVVTINTPLPGSQQYEEADLYGTLN